VKKLSKFLLLASFFGTCGESMITPIYSMFVSKIGGSIIDAGIGYAIFSIITGVLTIASAKIKWFCENLGLVVFLGFLIASIGDLSYVLVSGPIGLFVVQATNGISVGLLNPAWETLYTKDTDEGEEHGAWSLWGGGASISTGVAAIVGSVIASLFGFKAMFITTAAVNTVAVYYAYLIYKNESKTKG
jgi:predicted MFS family arabinose efflux permease